MLKVTTPALEQFKVFLSQQEKDRELFIRIFVNGFG